MIIVMTMKIVVMTMIIVVMKGVQWSFTCMKRTQVCTCSLNSSFLFSFLFDWSTSPPTYFTFSFESRMAPSSMDLQG
jgi:hypothetical protein